DYTGYKFGSYDPETLPEMIAKDGVIKVNYVKDDSQTKTISYTVEHWVVGEQTARDTETVSETKWVNEPDTLTVQEITHKSYSGYRFGNYNPEQLPETIAKDGIIKVNYVKTSSGGSSGGGGGSTPGRVTPSEGGPGVTIMPEDVPLAQLPGSPVDTTLIDDGEIPLAGLPKTGQSSVKSTLTMMMSGIFLVLTAMSKKRKEEDS
ncbi:doubled motif LPXTG anchor domain-containing protein, partial [Enterocloster citroniae]